MARYGLKTTEYVIKRPTSLKSLTKLPLRIFINYRRPPLPLLIQNRGPPPPQWAMIPKLRFFGGFYKSKMAHKRQKSSHGLRLRENGVCIWIRNQILLYFHVLKFEIGPLEAKKIKILNNVCSSSQSISKAIGTSGIRGGEGGKKL